MQFLRPLLAVKFVGDFDGRRDNNFTLIRLIFATAVLYGHSYAFGGASVDPISRYIEAWIGGLAVDGFFLFSGFLVAASFKRVGPVRYAMLRAARIYPAAIACVALSVIVGAIMTSLPVNTYLTSPLTWTFAGNATLLFTPAWFLPGVFEGHRFYGNVNGSYWSVILEARCYVLLLLAGFLGMLDTRARTNIAAILAYFLLTMTGAPLLIDSPGWIRPCTYFIIGVVLWANRDWLLLHWTLALVAVLVIASDVPYESLLFAGAWSYLLFYLVYGLPHVKIDVDLSYGVYLYAWPMQQMVWTEGQTGFENALLAAPLTFAAAAFSWFLIEKPMLDIVNGRRPLPLSSAIDVRYPFRRRA